MSGSIGRLPPRNTPAAPSTDAPSPSEPVEPATAPAPQTTTAAPPAELLSPPTPSTSVAPPAPQGVAGRRPEELFDYAYVGLGRPTPERPGYIAALLRGTDYDPVFSEDGGWLRRNSGAAGNWIADQINSGASRLVHRRLGTTVEVPLTDELLLGFTASARKLREDDIPIADPRRIAIERLRRAHPGAIPAWIEGSFGQNLAFNLAHSVPVGVGGGMVNFGFHAEQGLSLTMQRLVFFGGGSDEVANEESQLRRLAQTPLSAAEMAEVETGATFHLAGNAQFRLDAALGLGYAVPSIHEAVQVGASVEVGAYAALGGDFALTIQRQHEGRVRMTLASNGSISSGAQLKILVGIQVDRQEVSRLMRGFVDYARRGGDRAAFAEQLSNERERELCRDMNGYLTLLAKNLADGAGLEMLDYLVERYATAYLEARGGIDIASNFTTEIDYDFDANDRVTLPRADMVPRAMRGDTPADQPLSVRAGDVARLAYDLAVRGDLRLVQQLTLIRGAGVRVNERETRETTGTSSHIDLRLPFLEFHDHRATTQTTVDRFVPELGRTRTAIAAFNRDYRGLFGGAEVSSAEVRVHTPDGQADAEVFFASDENVSADFVVQNQVEPWTNFTEMQNYVGVLDVLSGGRLGASAREALRLGKYRDDDLLDDLNPIHQLFYKPREYGRTIAHLHIWLGEQGLRHLLARDLSDDQLYAEIGRVFANLDPGGSDALPDWARPRADRRLPHERGASSGESFTYADVGPWDHDLKTARYLVDNLKRLRRLMQAARTPAQEERVAGEIRDFLRDAKDKLPAYAALATLVPEEHRAVEMRLSAIRRGETPIRFTYIQDGRTSELLYATGLAKTALEQYQRYRPVLDRETRLRVGNVLEEVHGILNSPSPDVYRLKVAMRALVQELAFMDTQAESLFARIEEDIGLGRLFVDGLPDVRALQAVLPGDVGRELATLKLNATRYLSAPEPDLQLLRETFTSLLERMPQYRRVLAAGPLVESTARLANALAATEPQLAGEARRAVDGLREAITGGAAEAAFEARVAALTQLHGRLLAAAGDAAGGALLEEGVEAPVTPPAARTTGEAPDLEAARTRSAEQFRALAGNPNVAPLSYFERVGVVPRHYMGTPVESGGEGVVTGAMLRAADLEMAASRPSPDLGLPPVSAESLGELTALARAGKAKEFLARAEALAFRAEPILRANERRVLEYLLDDIPPSERQAFLQHLAPGSHQVVERLWAELATRRSRPDFRLDAYQRERQMFLRENPRVDEQLRYFKEVLAEDPQHLQLALNNLGYAPLFDPAQSNSTARLEAALSGLTGDQLNALAGEMDEAGRRRFLDLIRHSDLTPQTRARLAGQVVDDTFFWRGDEELVEALVTGMTAADLRVFFDQLHQDGKLEDFLQPASFWRTLLTLFTFGLARLFLHDNEAAKRVVVAQGWSVDELMLEYGTRRQHLTELERRAERVLFNATVDTIPMDPHVRGAVRTVHDLLGNVKYYHFAELPREAQLLLEEMAKGVGEQLVRRLGDVAKQGGSPGEILDEYKRFFAGLSPAAIAQQLETGDTDGSAALVSKALADGAVAGLIKAASNPSNRFITMQLVGNILHATNQLDSPVHFRPGGNDLRIDPASYDGLVEKAAFFSLYTGFDFSQVELLYGGFAVAAPAVVVGPTVSIDPARAPMVDGKIKLDDSFQQTIAFHETVHTLQQLVYGVQTNAFLDQAIHIGAGNDRGRAYRVTEEGFDAATSVHAFREHWEQQAELIEQSLRLLWSRAQATGSTNPAVYGTYVPGQVLEVAGGRIALTPARWAKMIALVEEFGQSARAALGRTGGRWSWQGAHNPTG